MHYLSEDDILYLHSIAIDEIGGLHGIRDHHAVLSLAGLPRQSFSGQELYPTLFDKAAVYARSISMNHPFLDGNKRTGMLAAGVFLEHNGYKVIVREGGVARFALRIVKQKLDIKEISAWLKKHSRKINQ